MDNEAELLNCTICNKVFTNAESLLKHMYSHDAEEQPLSFVPSDKKFESKVALNEKSESFNEGVEPLQSPLCRQVFAQADSLLHNPLLHGEEDNSLSVVSCDKEIESKVASNEHLKSESFNNEEEQVEITICHQMLGPQMFANNEELQDHLQSHHKNFPLHNDTFCNWCKEDVGTLEEKRKHSIIYDEESGWKTEFCFSSGPFISTEKATVDYGNSSKAIDGDFSKAVDGGNSSKAADRENFSTSEDRGNLCKSVDGGNSSADVDGGNSYKPVDGGNSSTAVDGGNSSTAVDGGNSSTAVDGGNSSTAVDGENSSKPVNGANSPKAGNEDIEMVKNTMITEVYKNYEWIYEEDSDMDEEFNFVNVMEFFNEDSVKELLQHEEENPSLQHEEEENPSLQQEEEENPSLQHIEQADRPEADEEEYERFPCHLCTLVFDTIEDLERHLKSEPFYNEGENHPCTLCSEVFDTKEGLDNHMWTHNESFPLFNIDRCICPECYEEMDYVNKEKHKCISGDDSDNDMPEEHVVRGPGAP